MSGQVAESTGSGGEQWCGWSMARGGETERRGRSRAAAGQEEAGGSRRKQQQGSIRGDGSASVAADVVAPP